MRIHLQLGITVACAVLVLACTSAQNTPPAGAPPTSAPAPAATTAPASTTVSKPAATAPAAPAAQPTSAPKPPSATSTPAPAPGKPAGAPAKTGEPARVVAERGNAVYVEHCAACHGAEGQGVVGPALWGDQADLTDRGQSAADLLEFVSTAMPQHSPGSLSSQQYFDVVTYLLRQGDLVPPDQLISRESMGDVALTR